MREKKIGLLVIASTIAVVAMIFAIQFAGINQYKKQIPGLPD